MTDDRPIAADEPSPAERLLAGFAADLAAEERALGPVEPDELAAAADGGLDAAALAVWQERVARRPELAARVEDLAVFRREAYPEPARLVIFPRAQRTAWRWAAALAAALLVALLGWARTRERSSPPPAQSIFSDGFESGDASRWATDSPS
jgi:hypothetical protein